AAVLIASLSRGMASSSSFRSFSSCFCTLSPILIGNKSFIFGVPSRNRIRSISFSACFISEMDSSLSFWARRRYPQFLHIVACKKYWFTAVSSALSTSFSSLMICAFPFIVVFSRRPAGDLPVRKLKLYTTADAPRTPCRRRRWPAKVIQSGRLSASYRRRGMPAVTRRAFMGAAAAGALNAAKSLSAASYARVIGANDRIAIGLIGCGARSAGHRRMAKTSAKDMNVEITAVCDLWTHNREKSAADVEEKFGKRPRAFKYHEDLLNLKDVDAVMIATGDFQHAKILVDVVKAGKDCYCEKPMANVLEEAKLARDTVLASKQIVQMGSQWVSDPYQLAVRDIVRSGQLGQITRIEQVWNKNEERWRGRPEVKMIREEDTDWKRWLLGK